MKSKLSEAAAQAGEESEGLTLMKVISVDKFKLKKINLQPLINSSYPNKSSLIYKKQASKQLKTERKQQKKSISIKSKKQREKRQFRFWGIFSDLLDLDWFLVGIVVLLPALLIAGLYILLGAMALSFFEMFLLALGFGFTVFIFVLLASESNLSMAFYDFFIKYGFVSWIGVLALIAGFIALFGGSGGALVFYLLIGAILALLSFLLSILLKDSILGKG